MITCPAGKGRRRKSAAVSAGTARAGTWSAVKHRLDVNVHCPEAGLVTPGGPVKNQYITEFAGCHWTWLQSALIARSQTL